MFSDHESVYSPETSGVAAGEQALILGRRQLEQQLVMFKKKMDSERALVAKEKQQVEAARSLVRQQEANNWLETRRVEAEKASLDHDAAIVLRDKEINKRREIKLNELENQRRLNRRPSIAFIEDSFSSLNAKSVLENLTNSSLSISKHAMANISACIAGFKEAPPTFARFTPQDMAPDLLPKLQQLVSTLKKPLDEVVQFAENVVSAQPVAKALALNGECFRLAEFLIETNEFTSRLAVCALDRMVGMETAVVKPAYEAISRVISNIPIPELGQSSHPAVDFIKKVAPKITEDCFNNGLWSSVAPLAGHRIAAIRQIVLHKILLLTQHSDRNQHGLVEAHRAILGCLDQYYQLSSPPPDIIAFFVEILPLVAERLCHRSDGIQWLLTRLCDPSPKITEVVIAAFRTAGVVKQDPIVLQMLVKVDLLRKLNEPPTQESSYITQLICQLLPVLAIPYARVKAAEGIVGFLDHSEPAVADACLSACIRIVNSTIEDRSHLFSVINRLNSEKVSTLKLYDHMMPAVCKDWVASGDFKMIVQFIQHSEERIRHPAQKVWSEIICNSPSARSKIVHDGLLDVIFELCRSQYHDTVLIGATCCSPMAIEITKSGVNSTRQLVELLAHPLELLRQAALCGIQIASESNDANCKVLLEADAFKGLHLFFGAYPKDLLDNAPRILTRFAPFLYTSAEACTGLLQLLESSSALVEHAARSALTTISNSGFDDRQTLRNVVLNCLQLPSEIQIQYAVKAIQDWIGPDLAQLNDFTTFFSLILHSDRRVQTAAMISLRQKLSNSDHQQSLEKADVVFLIRTLSDSDNSEALNFVMEALRVLALSLARNGHSSTIIALLMHKEPKVREGAAAALETIVNGSVQERKLLLEEDIIEKLINHECLDQMQLHLLSSIIPKLAIDYCNAGKMELILTLVDHKQQQIRTAATKSVTIIAGGNPEQKALLRDVLLPRLDQASPLLREVAGNWMSRTLAHDLVVDGDFIRLFCIFESEDIRVREPVTKELRSHIQSSDEAARQRLVEAGIFPAMLQAYTPTKDDLLTFLTTCVLPLLGPAFTQNDGGSTLFPLLMHGEPRIRAAAIQALKNAIHSRHGNVENMAKACAVETLHPLTLKDEAVRDLWCRILPQAAHHLENRVEIDILFESLKDHRKNVREAASEALTIMAKTSEVTRGNMFPALLHNLEKPSPEALPLIVQATSLSGSAFVSSGKEAELFNLILYGEPDIVVAAIEATIQLLTKGSSFEHQKLFKADVFSVALKLHNQRSQRQYSLQLLRAIVSHLSYAILTHDDLAKEMFSLFDDPDPGLSTALYQTWSSDSRVYESDALPELLPLLFDNNKLRNPSVVALLRQIAPDMVRQLVNRRRLDIIVKALMINNSKVTQAFLQETCIAIQDSTESEKKLFVNEPSFVSGIGRHLQGQDATMRRDSSNIVQLLSKGSQSRSAKFMTEGIGQYLSWLAVNGEKGAQKSSLDALYALFMAAPDQASRLVTEALPALCDIFDDDGQVLNVCVSALSLLLEIVQQSSLTPVIESGILVNLVRWLSPRHSVTDMKCRGYVFEICEIIAQKSDPGRQALIEAKVLPELSSLATSQKAIEVISACKILKALAHTGTFRKDIISAGLKDVMKGITSPLHKSTLKSKEDKQLAKASAKEVLEKLGKPPSIESLTQINTAPRNPRLSFRRSVSEAELRPRGRRNESGSEFSSAGPSEYNPHSQSFTEAGRLALSRVEGARLSAVHEDETTNVEDESSTARPRRRTTRRELVDDPVPSSVVEDEDFVTSPRRAPSYRTVSETVRQQILEDHLLSSVAEEEDFVTNPRITGRVPSYRTVPTERGFHRG